MRAWTLAAVVLAVSTLPACADDIMANYTGNTIIAKTATTELHIHYKADHTFDAQGTSAKGPFALKGTWTFDAKGLCRNYDPPMPNAANPVCAPLEAHKIGETWSMPNVTLTLVQGNQ
jgi:hypothetical protein